MAKFFTWLSLLFFTLFALLSAVFCFSPSFREKIFLLGLTPMSPAIVQKFAARELENYPTKMTAVVLVIFTNFKYRPPVARAKIEQSAKAKNKSISDVEVERLYIKARKERQANVDVANEALRTLCIMTGQNFGTPYVNASHIRGWTALSDDEWKGTLSSLNTWAAITFGGAALREMGINDLGRQITQELRNLLPLFEGFRLMKKALRMALFFFVLAPLMIWGLDHAIEKKTGRSFLDAVVVPWKTRFYLSQLRHPNAFVASDAWANLQQLYNSYYSALNIITGFVGDNESISFLIEREAANPAAEPPVLPYFSVNRRPIFYKTNQVFCHTVGEAIMAMLYNERRWRKDFVGDWSVWWQANRGYYGS